MRKFLKWWHFAIAVIFFSPAIIYLMYFSGSFSENQNDWAAFGTLWSGGLAGLALVMNVGFMIRNSYETKKNNHLNNNRKEYDKMLETHQQYNKMLIQTGPLLKLPGDVDGPWESIRGYVTESLSRNLWPEVRSDIMEFLTWYSERYESAIEPGPVKDWDRATRVKFYKKGQSLQRKILQSIMELYQ